jgi:cbb3-type cytochrome oxidase subunit 3
MRSILKVWLLLLLLTALLVGLWWGFEGGREGVTTIIDDDGVSMASGDALVGFGGLLLGALFFAVVVPVALLLAVGVPLLLVGGALVIGLIALGVGLATALSPLLLPLLLVWWLLRRDRRQRMAAASTPPASTTIAA